MVEREAWEVVVLLMFSIGDLTCVGERLHDGVFGWPFWAMPSHKEVCILGSA